MIISRASKSFRWFYGVSLACGAMCLILAIGGRTIAAGVFGAAAGVFGYCWPVRRCGLSVIGKTDALASMVIAGFAILVWLVVLARRNGDF